jgi:hypothetical protein
MAQALKLRLIPTPIRADQNQTASRSLRERPGESLKQQIQAFLPGIKPTKVEEDQAVFPTWAPIAYRIRDRILAGIDLLKGEPIGRQHEWCHHPISANIFDIADGMHESRSIEELQFEEVPIGLLGQPSPLQNLRRTTSVGCDGIGNPLSPKESSQGYVNRNIVGVEVNYVRMQGLHSLTQ